MNAPVRALLAGGITLLTALVAFPVAQWGWSEIGRLAARTTVLPSPEAVEYVVVPHAGDELQAWSLLQNDTTTYKVFILTSRDAHGEESAGSDVAAWVDRFERLGQLDGTLPTDLEHLGVRGPFPDPKGQVCRDGDSAKLCRAAQSAEVWRDRAGRGALVVLDLGRDGLSRGEVAWAVRTTKHNREALGLDDSLPNGALIGAAYFGRGGGCVRYEGADHYAVHKVLHDIDLYVAAQLAATCADDGEATKTGTVRPDVLDVFRSNPVRAGRLGPKHGSPATVDPRAQRRPFHSRQVFWEKKFPH